MDEACQFVTLLKELHMTITTMESCSGGAIIDAITSVEGASNVTEGGFVTYSNAQKIRMGVSENVIEEYGVYSPECALEMARVAQAVMDVSMVISVTGTFSNVDPNNADSRPGEVHYCIHRESSEPVLRTLSVPIMGRMLQKQFIIAEVLKEATSVLLSS